MRLRKLFPLVVGAIVALAAPALAQSLPQIPGGGQYPNGQTALNSPVVIYSPTCNGGLGGFVGVTYGANGVCTLPGSGGSGGGGAVTVAAGADVTEGNTTDQPCASPTSNCSMNSVDKALLAAASSYIPQVPTPSAPGVIGATEPSAGTVNGATDYGLSTTASTNAVLLGTAGAHNVYDLQILNPTATFLCVYLYDTGSTPVPGTTSFKNVFPIGGVSTVGQFVSGAVFTFPVGKAFVSGLGVAVTGGTANTCPGTETSNAPVGVSVNLDYK